METNQQEKLSYYEIVEDCTTGINLFENCPEPLDFNAECRIFVMNVCLARILRTNRSDDSQENYAFNVIILHEMQERIRPSIIDRGKFSSGLAPLITALDKVLIQYYFADAELDDEMVAELYRLIQSPMWREKNPTPSEEFKEALKQDLMAVAQTFLIEEGFDE